MINKQDILNMLNNIESKINSETFKEVPAESKIDVHQHIKDIKKEVENMDDETLQKLNNYLIMTYIDVEMKNRIAKKGIEKLIKKVEGKINDTTK